MAQGDSTDCAGLVLEEDLQAHSARMHETVSNAESAHSIVRHAAAGKFADVDPIEAASAEMILTKTST